MVSVQTPNQDQTSFTFLNYPSNHNQIPTTHILDLCLIHRRKVMVSLALCYVYWDLLGSNSDPNSINWIHFIQHLPIHMEKKLQMFSPFLQATLITNRYHIHHQMEFPKLKLSYIEHASPFSAYSLSSNLYISSWNILLCIQPNREIFPTPPDYGSQPKSDETWRVQPPSYGLGQTKFDTYS